jgi:hypothetical protein
MPNGRIVLSLTGLSSTNGYPLWVPDTAVRPFNIGFGVVLSSTSVGQTYSIEHSMDFTGSSAFLSSNATWFANSTAQGATSNLTGNYAFPVSAIRLNVTAGSSTATTTATLIQAG